MVDDRQKSGILSGCIGLALNILLGAAKLAIGLITGSVSVLSDAANNLSDAGSSAMTVASFGLSGRRADRDHPYGHGRYEYIAGFLIGVVIVFVGAQFALSSIGKIITPTPIDYDAWAIAVLGLSIGVKLFMGVFYLLRGKKIGSDTLRAAAFDSFSDMAVTAGLLVSVIVGKFVAYPTEGIVGLVISIVIVIGGIKVLIDTVNRLLGRGGDSDTEKKLTELILQGDSVRGVHDLRVHDYGPNHKIATADAEMDGDMTVSEAHAVLDEIEDKAMLEYGIDLTLHCDPIDRSDVTLNRLRTAVAEVLQVYAGAGMHDLDVHYADRRIDLHITLPASLHAEFEHIRGRIREAVEQVVAGFELSLTVDTVYE